MHELLMKVARMRLKSDFSAKVFVLRSLGYKLIPSPLKGRHEKLERVKAEGG